MAIDFEWNERNEKTVLEWGYAAVRCGHLEAYVNIISFIQTNLTVCIDWVTGHRFQILITGSRNILLFNVGLIMCLSRKGHYIVADYVDKVINKYSPTYPWQVSSCL